MAWAHSGPCWAHVPSNQLSVCEELSSILSLSHFPEVSAKAVASLSVYYFCQTSYNFRYIESETLHGWRYCFNSLRTTWGRFDLGSGGGWVSVLCLKSRSMHLCSCKRNCPVGYCVNGSIVQEGHSLGNTDEGVIRVLVIGKDAFPVIHTTCSLVEKNS